MKRADEIIVAFPALIIERGTTLNGADETGCVERGFDAERKNLFCQIKRIAPVTVSHRTQRGAGIIVERQFALHVLFGANEQKFERRIVETVQHHHLRTRQHGSVQLE